jgi:hypothetical protein
MQAHCEHIIDSAYLVRLEDTVYQLLAETILNVLLLDGYWPAALERMKFEAFFLTQKEGDICTLVFGFNKFDGGIQQLVQVVRPEDGLIEIRYKTYDAKPFDKVSLGRNKVIAEYIDFQVLLFAILVQLLYQQAQSSVSLFIVHNSSLFERSMKLVILPGFSKFGLLTARLYGANQDLRTPYG